MAGGRYVALSIRLIRSNEFDDTQSIDRHVGQTNIERLYRRISDISFVRGFLSCGINTNRLFYLYHFGRMSAASRQHQFAPLRPLSADARPNDNASGGGRRLVQFQDFWVNCANHNNKYSDLRFNGHWLRFLLLYYCYYLSDSKFESNLSRIVVYALILKSM